MIRNLCLALALLAITACKTIDGDRREGGYAPGARPVHAGAFIEPFLKLP